MFMEAVGYVCPHCGNDRQFVQELVVDDDGFLAYTVLVCKACGGWFEEAQ